MQLTEEVRTLLRENEALRKQSELVTKLQWDLMQEKVERKYLQKQYDVAMKTIKAFENTTGCNWLYDAVAYRMKFPGQKHSSENQN